MTSLVNLVLVVLLCFGLKIVVLVSRSYSRTFETYTLSSLGSFGHEVWILRSIVLSCKNGVLFIGLWFEPQ